MRQARRIVWFSCGAASACAAKLTLEKHPEALVVYCDTASSEHPDNRRFLRDVQRWLGKRVKKIASKKFKHVREVFEKTRYMSGPMGARCTTEMKKIPRFDFQRGDDIHIFGFTADELDRQKAFRERNPELHLEWPLIEAGLDKNACMRMIQDARIKLPAMYLLGFRNNNCLGCVKAASPAYWNKIRKHFPGVFADRAKQSRELGVRLVKLDGERIFLDELEPERDLFTIEDNVSCGPECGSPS